MLRDCLSRGTCILCFFLLLVAGTVAAQQTVQDRPALLVLTLNGNHYLTSAGGLTKNGCEAWLTMLKSGETVYVARCDQGRLEELDMGVEAVLVHNGNLEPRRRVVAAGDPMMIDFVDFKMQALIGPTNGGALVYLIMNAAGKLEYYRAEGSVEQLSTLGFDIDALVQANDGVDAASRVTVSGGRYNVAERISDRAQMLVGKTDRGILTAVVVDGRKRLSQVITE